MGHFVVGGVEGDGVGADEELGWGGSRGRCADDGEGAGGGLNDAGLGWGESGVGVRHCG